MVPSLFATVHSIKESVRGLTNTVAKKLNLQSANCDGVTVTENGITANGNINGVNHAKSTTTRVHPLDPLTPDEITSAAAILRSSYLADSPIHFKAVTLDEPPKQLVLRFLDAEHNGSITLPNVPRTAYVLYVMLNTRKTFEAIVDLMAQKVVSNSQIPSDCHAAADTSELYEIEEIALSSPEVKKELERLNLPAGSIVACDPWTYGSDGDDDQTRKWQCYMYLRDPSHNHPESNHYAIPLDFSPRIDDATKKVDKIIRLPLFETFDATQTDYTVPEGNEYHHDLVGTKRTGLKPYNVVQPEGPSYSIGGNVIEWQKWRFRVGFNYREGVTLHDIRYDRRSVFYRLSLSDMFVPYADPRAPYHRKSAFDFGDVGAGITANNLKLGCDCLGVIKVSNPTFLCAYDI